MKLRCRLSWPDCPSADSGHDTVEQAKRTAAVITEDGLTWIRDSATGEHRGYWRRDHPNATLANRNVPAAIIRTFLNLRSRVP